MFETIGKISVSFRVVLFSLFGILFIFLGIKIIQNRNNNKDINCKDKNCERDNIITGIVFILCGLYGLIVSMYYLYQTYTNRFIALTEGLSTIL